MSVCVGLCVGGEGLQWLGWLPGTADGADALASLMGAGLGLWLGSRTGAAESKFPEPPLLLSPLVGSTDSEKK